MSNQDWTNPHDPDAKITKMKDGSTHLAHKAEHAVDMETGAVVAVTLQGADQGDTTTYVETLIEAATQIAAAAEVANSETEELVNPEGPAELVTDKGYHSNEVLKDLKAVGVRSYVPEPDRGRRNWGGKQPEQEAVYGNRRRIQGARGKRLLKQRGEKLERSFAHMYETGGMRRTHLRGHQNILKRLVVHAGAFNLGLLLRQYIGVGTPRGLQDRGSAPRVVQMLALIAELIATAFPGSFRPPSSAPNVKSGMIPSAHDTFVAVYFVVENGTFATGC